MRTHSKTATLMLMALGIIVVGVAVAAPCPARAQGFGVQQGTPLNQLRVVRRTASNQYVVVPPAPQPGFDEYIVTLTPETGVCRVTGIGDTLRRDNDGTQARRRFRELERELTAAHGRSRTFDYLKADSALDDPDDWATAVSKHERSLVIFWDHEERSSLPAGVGSVTLQVEALDASRTYVNVKYEFDNINACVENLRPSTKGDPKR